MAFTKKFFYICCSYDYESIHVSMSRYVLIDINTTPMNIIVYFCVAITEVMNAFNLLYDMTLKRTENTKIHRVYHELYKRN